MIINNPEFKGFTRNDYQRWSGCSMFFVAVTILPIRIVVCFVFIVVLVVFSKLLTLFCCVFDFKKKQNCLFRFLAIGLLTISVRIVMIAMGFHWFSYKKKESNQANTLYFTNKGNVKNSVIICNHTSFIDILFFLAQPKPVGFISNHNVKNYPIWGYFAQLIQSIFVNRNDKESRIKCMEDLKQRCIDLKNHPRCK